MSAVDEDFWAIFWTMTDAELNAFPLGIVRLDKHGTIHLFNAAEERFMRKAAADTIGLNYFFEVAPCAAVQAFHGRFCQFVNSSGARSEIFSFFFPFGWGQKEVRITMLKRALDDWIYIVDEVVSVTDDARVLTRN